MIHSEFVYNALHPYCHAATLAETGEGDLVAAWYAYPEEETKDARLVLARRPRGEAAWGAAKGLFGKSSFSSGNPVLFEDPAGTLWLHFVVLRGSYWNDAQLMAARSGDGGRTWDDPFAISKKLGMMVRHRPLALADGRLLLPAYLEEERESVLLASRAPFVKWEVATRFEGYALIQPDLIRDEAGRMTLLFRPASEPCRMWRSHSGDDGASWSPPVQTPLPVPLTGVAGFAAGGRLFAVYNHTEAHQRFPLSLAASADGGLSWSAPYHLDTVKQEVSYPTFLVGRDGRVHGMYTYNRRMMKYLSIPISEVAGLL